MKAIQVKYLSPTNTKGSRIKAIAEGVKPLTFGFDHGYTFEGNAFIAAHKLCEVYNWPKKLSQGSLPNGDIVFTFII